MRLGLRGGFPVLSGPWRWARTLIRLLTDSIILLRDSIVWPISTLRLLSQNPFRFRYGDIIDDQHVRLIRLPSDQCLTDPPSLTIHTFPLSQCPPYFALSYTWGPSQPSSKPYTPRDRISIRVNNQPFPVFENLFHALSQLCSSHAGEYFWVDSICINQARLEERAAQVAIMDRVYTSAQGTVIWLGPETERTARAVRLAHQIATGAGDKILHWVSSQTLGDVFVADDAQLLTKNGLPPLTADNWLDLADIFTRTWFGRVWMIQEVALATNPTVIIGQHQLPWDDIGYSSQVIALSNAILGLFAVGPGIQLMTLVIGIMHAANLQVIRERSHGETSDFFGISSSLDFAAGMASENATSVLFQLLVSSNGFQATYRRDRVYALLGITNQLARDRGHEPLVLEVDYLSTDEQVLSRLGITLLQEMQSLHLLSHAGLAGRAIQSNLPTWIPSFEYQHVPILGPTYTSLRPFNACSSATQDSQPSSNFTVDAGIGRLHVKAVSPHLGTIEALGETWPEMLRGNFLESIRMLLHCGDTYSYTNEPIVEAFWRTLIMDFDMAQRSAPSHLGHSFAAWLKLITIGACYNSYRSSPFLFDIFDSLEPLWTLGNSRDATNLLPKTSEMFPLLCSLGLINNPDIPRVPPAEEEAMMEDLGKQAAPYEGMLRLTLLTKRRLARTVRGYLCLVPHEAELGDRVMIVAGCPVPLVLRREMSIEDCFRVVGDVYVHGAMFGEHLKGDISWRDVSLV